MACRGPMSRRSECTAWPSSSGKSGSCSLYCAYSHSSESRTNPTIHTASRRRNDNKSTTAKQTKKKINNNSKNSPKHKPSEHGSTASYQSNIPVPQLFSPFGFLKHYCYFLLPLQGRPSLLGQTSYEMEIINRET